MDGFAARSEYSRPLLYHGDAGLAAPVKLKERVVEAGFVVGGPGRDRDAPSEADGMVTVVGRGGLLVGKGQGSPHKVVDSGVRVTDFMPKFACAVANGKSCDGTQEEGWDDC